MLNRSLIFLLCVMAALLAASCTNSTSPNLEQSLDLFSGLEAIPEAQNTTVTINRGTDATDGYFTINIEDVADNPILGPGTHEAWCLEWHKNLRSNGDVHQDVKWFDTGNNDTWKPLNYLFSIRGELQANDPDLTFRDIQAVVWVLAGEMGIAPEFDVLNLPADRIPSRLRNGSELAIDREKVASIARRVMQEAPEAIGLASGTVAQTAQDEQDTYTPPPAPLLTCGEDVNFMYNGSDVTYGTVTGANDSCWLDRNLGATKVAEFDIDTGAYGDYFTFDQAVNACPVDFRLATEAEWEAERLSWGSNNAIGAINSPLKLTMAGRSNGENFIGVGTLGYYWSSVTVSDAVAKFLIFGGGTAGIINSGRMAGLSVRCIKEDTSD